MSKNKKKFLTVSTAALVTASTISPVLVGATDSGETPSIGGNTSLEGTEDVRIVGDYKIKGSTGEILEYLGSATSISIPSVIDGVQILKISDRAFFKKQLTSVVLPEGLLEIGISAFEDNRIGSLTIANSTKTIGASAFAGNPLTSLTLGSSVEEIGDNAFDGKQIRDSGKITNLILPETLKKIGKEAFRYHGITSITIPDSVDEIGIYAFSYNSISSFSLPDSMTIIPEGLFHFNTMTSIVIDEGITEIGKNAFSSNLATQVEFPSTLINIGEAAFKNNKIKEVVLKPQYSFGNEAFAVNYIDTLTIEDGVKEIPFSLFHANRLTSVDLNQVEVIGENAFEDNDITEIDFGMTRHIKSDAFRYNSISSLTIPSTVEIIESGAFNTNTITILNLNKNIKQLGGGLYSLDESVFGNNNIEKLIIPKGFSPETDTESHFSRNNITKIISYENDFSVVNLFKSQKHSNDSNVVIYGQPETELQSSTLFASHTFRDINSYDENALLSDFDSRLTTNSNVTLVGRNKYEVNISGLSSGNEVSITVGDNAPVLVPVTNGQYELKYNYGIITQDTEVEITVEDSMSTVEDKVLLKEIDSYNILDVEETYLDKNSYRITAKGYTDSNSVNLHFNDEIVTVAPDSNGYYEASKDYLITQDVEIVVMSENNIDEPVYAEPINLVYDESILNYTIRQERKGDGRIDVLVDVETNSPNSYVYWHIIPKLLFNKNVFDPIPSYFDEEKELTFYDMEGNLIESGETNKTLDRINLTQEPFSRTLNPSYSRAIIPYEDVDPNDPSTFENYTISALENQAFEGVKTYTFPNIISEDTSIWVYIMASPTDAYMERIDLYYTAEGKVNVKYVDENGQVLQSETRERVKVNEAHTETAIEIEGYTLIPTEQNSKTVTLSQEGEVQEIVFTYKKDVMNDGSILVKYINMGSVIETETISELEYGTHTVRAKTISGYTLNDTSEKQVILDELNKNAEVEFSYFRNEIAGPSASLTVKYVDENGNIIYPSQTKNPGLGLHVESAMEIEGYTLQGAAEQTLNFTSENLIQEVTFVYKNNSPTIDNPETNGFVTIKYVDLSGIEIAPSVTKIVPFGNHTEESIEINGYKIVSEESSTVSISDSNLEQTITFVYDLIRDPEPTDPEPTDPEPTDPEPTDPEPTDPEPTDPEPTDPEPTNPEPTDPGDTNNIDNSVVNNNTTNNIDNSVVNNNTTNNIDNSVVNNNTTNNIDNSVVNNNTTNNIDNSVINNIDNSVNNNITNNIDVNIEYTPNGVEISLSEDYSDYLNGSSELIIKADGIYILANGAEVKISDNNFAKNLGNKRAIRLTGNSTSSVMHYSEDDTLRITTKNLKNILITNRVNEPFIDVSSSDWFYDDVLEAYNMVFTKGTTATTFEPNGEITRAEFAVMIARALEITEFKKYNRYSLSDLKGTWYADEVEMLLNLGIIQGYANGKFGGNDKLTREQAMTILGRTLEYLDVNTKSSEQANVSDYNEISNYAKDYISFFASNGVLVNGNEIKFNPKDNLTRAEMSKVLVKSLQLTDKY